MNPDVTGFISELHSHYLVGETKQKANLQRFNLNLTKAYIMVVRLCML